MWKGVLARPWIQQLVVALGYSLVYTVTARVFAEARWPATAALRICCLLLIPYRYWPVIVLGEFFPLVELNHEYKFGWPYTLLASFPPIALGMPIAWWFRSKANLFPAPELVNVKKLLGCVLALTIVWATTRYALLFTIQLSSGPYRVPEGTLFLFLLNFYVVMLIATPWAVMIRIHNLASQRAFAPLRSLIDHPLLQDLAVATLALAGLAYLHQIAISIIKPATLMALFLPAAWLALRHGWRAAVAGGTLSLIVTWLLVEKWPNDAILQAQMFMAIAMTSLYTFGAQTSSQWRLYEQALRDMREVQKLAQETFVSGEMRLRHTSQALECVASILRLDHEHVLNCYVPEDARKAYNEQAMHLQRSVYRMAENIHPSAWRERGPAAAFYETIGQTLTEASIDYGCEVPWKRLPFLSTALQTALYRTACETAALLSASPACSGIYLTMRIGKRDGIYWAALRIENELDDAHVADAILHAVERQRIAAKLGTAMSTTDELKQWARVFDGKLRLRKLADGIRVTALLFDSAAHPEVRHHPMSHMQLLVT